MPLMKGNLYEIINSTTQDLNVHVWQRKSDSIILNKIKYNWKKTQLHSQYIFKKTM